MASLKDIPVVLRKVGPLQFTKNVLKQMSEDNTPALAASMSYAWLLAIFPFIVFIMSVLPYVPFLQTTEAGRVADELLTTLPDQAEEMIRAVGTDVLSQQHGGLLSVGIIVALWVASGGMSMTIAALCRCYDVPDRPMYRGRPLAVLLTIIIVSLILSAVLLLPVTSIVKAWIQQQPNMFYIVDGVMWLIDLARWALALFALLMALAFLYHLGPNIKQTFHFITPGSVFVIASWIALGLGFRYYVDNFGNYNRTYGTLGGVIILLVLFYLDSLVLLIGAEINSEIDFALRPQAGVSAADFRESPAEEAVANKA